MKRKVKRNNTKNLQEIDGIKGIFDIVPQKIMYEFTSNSNFIYCKDYETGKILKTKQIEESY